MGITGKYAEVFLFSSAQFVLAWFYEMGSLGFAHAKHPNYLLIITQLQVHFNDEYKGFK